MVLLRDRSHHFKSGTTMCQTDASLKQRSHSLINFPAKMTWRIPFPFLLTSKIPRVSALPMLQKSTNRWILGNSPAIASNSHQEWNRQIENRLGAIGLRTGHKSAIKDLKISSVVYRLLKCSCKVATLNCMASKWYYLPA